MPLMNQSIFQSTCDHERSVTMERTKRLVRVRNNHVEPRWFGNMKRMRGGLGLGGVSGVSHQLETPGRHWVSWVQLTWKHLWVLPEVSEGRSLGIPATFWGTLLPSTQFLHWGHCRKRMSSRLTGLRSLSCKGPERPGFVHETPTGPRTLESYGAWEQSLCRMCQF